MRSKFRPCKKSIKKMGATTPKRPGAKEPDNLPGREKESVQTNTVSVGGRDAAMTGTLEACRYIVAAAILAASNGGFQPRVSHPSDKVSHCAQKNQWRNKTFAKARPSV